VEVADAVGVLVILLRGHGEPGVVHAEGLEDVVADPFVVRLAGEAVDDFAEDVPGGVGVVAGFEAGGPVAFDFHGVDFGEGFLPGGEGVGEVHAADAGGVGEEVADGDLVFTVGGEFGDDRGDFVVEAEFVLFDEHGDGDGGDGLAGGEPEEESVGGHGGGGGGEAGVAEGEVGDGLAVDEGVELGADVEAFGEGGGEDGGGFGKVEHGVYVIL